ncbi:MAG: DEAD/DEAH box helicase [Bacteroidia bacterium]|nr:DEAD/DEAH box helicase [Bacteroidia bacterium]MBP9688858.1 DEAD/DEAH box helicase [Bacteroidia bacterium]
MNFKDLNINNPLLKALEDLEYIHPTPVQVESYPVIMSGRDVVGIAQTGTGKTFAYLLPVLRQLKFSEQRHPRVLIVVPTRELVMQVYGEVKRLTKYMTIRTGAMYGGGNINKQKEMVFAGLDVLVSTPGRLIDLASIGAIKLTSIQKLIIDEVDEMLEQEFRSQLTSIIDYLPLKRQNILFSATLTEEVEKYFGEFFNNPIKVEVAAHGTPLEKIIQYGYQVPNFGTKVNLLTHLLQTDDSLGKVLVFVSKIKNADKLYEMMHQNFAGNIGLLHSRKPQNQRFEALRQFADNEHRILIATDVAARGLDVVDVTHVINFDTPDNSNDYLHRIGRTGRIGKDGTAITFMNPAEEEYMPEIEEVMHKEVNILAFPKEVALSKIFSDDEKPKLREKNYLKSVKKTEDEKGASFHDKKAKNQKVNLGGKHKKTGGKGRSVNRNVLRKRSAKNG